MGMGNGFGLAQQKKEGMCCSFNEGLEWHGNVEEMEKQYRVKYDKWYYFFIRKIVRKIFVNAWHSSLKAEAKRKRGC